MECSAEERAEISAAPGVQAPASAETFQQPQQAQQQPQQQDGDSVACTGGPEVAGAELAEAEEEEQLVEYGPALPPPPDALTLLGQYNDSWQQLRDQSPRQPAGTGVADGLQPEQAECSEEAEGPHKLLPDAAEPGDMAGQEGGAALQSGSEQQVEEQPAEAAAAPAAAGGAPAEAGSGSVQADEGGEQPPPPAGLPPDVWAIMHKLAKFVQVGAGSNGARVKAQACTCSGLTVVRMSQPPSTLTQAGCLPHLQSAEGQHPPSRLCLCKVPQLLLALQLPPLLVLY